MLCTYQVLQLTFNNCLCQGLIKRSYVCINYNIMYISKYSTQKLTRVQEIIAAISSSVWFFKQISDMLKVNGFVQASSETHGHSSTSLGQHTQDGLLLMVSSTSDPFSVFPPQFLEPGCPGQEHWCHPCLFPLVDTLLSTLHIQVWRTVYPDLPPSHP